MDVVMLASEPAPAIAPAAPTAVAPAPPPRITTLATAAASGHPVAGPRPGEPGVAPIDPYGATAGSGAGRPGDAPPSLMEMRRPRVALELPAAVVDREQRRDALPPSEVPATGQLAPAGGGTFQANEGVFNARVDRDGTAHLRDGANLHVEVHLPTRKAVGDALHDWYDTADKSDRDKEKVAINNHRAHDEDTRPDHGQVVPLVGGGFDSTDALMRRHGQDPYASRKLKFLDSTRDERAAIGAANRRADLKQSTQLMQKSLQRLAAELPDLAARREVAFELWDDCAETGDPDLVAGGAAARALVVGYIRGHFAAGTAAAYPAAELAALNRRRRSTAPFAPY
jgi:hypothetical protein